MPDTERVDPFAWFDDEVMRLLPDLHCCAKSMTDNPADADDLVAEAIARAWAHRDQLEERKRFRGWLFRILRNCFLSRYRMRQARPTELSLDEEVDESSFSLFDQLHQPFLLWWGNPEKDFLNGVLKEDLRAAVERLPEYYRVAVILADVQGLSYAEIAEALEVPVNTVRSRLARGRARLQRELWNHAVERGLRPADATGRGGMT